MLHSNWTSYIALHHFIIHRFNSRSSNSWQRRPFLLSFGFCVDVFFKIQYNTLSMLAGCENIFTWKTLKFKFGLLQTSRCISLNSERCGGMGVTDAVRQTPFFPKKYEAY